MDDLISRSALLKEIDETAEAVEEQNVLADIKKAFLDALATVREHVVNMPTAYNLDKVVEQINDEIKSLDNKNKICLDVGDFKSSDIYATRMVDVIKVRELVKAGGVNG